MVSIQCLAIFNLWITWLIAYLWLACQAFAKMKLRLFVPLDFVTDVTILEIPGGQLPCSRLVWTQWGRMYPSRGWDRGGSQVFLEAGVTQLRHECLLSAPGSLPLLDRRERVSWRRCTVCPSPFVNIIGATFIVHERHHLFSGACLHIQWPCRSQLPPGWWWREFRLVT